MSLKQGLNYLIEQARQRGYRPHYDQKAIIIPIFSFINQLIASIKGFLNTREYDCWYAYFLDHHLYDRTLPNMIKSWQKLKDTSLECHLLQTLLTVRNRNKLRLYLKARKYILQTAAENSMLDEVLLDLQDSIAIIHRIFSNEEIRKALVQGIKNIFLAFKISQAKLYSSVLIEYLLAVYDSIIQIESEEATISGQFSTNRSASRPYNQTYQELFSSISNFQSSIHNENGFYKKSSFSHTHATQKKYQIIEKKFLPLKQTSQYISNSNKFSSASKQKTQHQKDKSVFYDFISNRNQVEEYLSQKSHAMKVQSSHFSQSHDETSFEKQQRFYHKMHMQPSHDKSSSPSPQTKKQTSKQKGPVFPQKSFVPHRQVNPQKSVSPQPVSRFIKKQPEINPKKDQPKNFSLGWFSNKMFETENVEQGRQSFLLKSRAKILKKADQKRRQSTERYEIENHLMYGSSKRVHNLNFEKDYAAESDKSQEFQKMVYKNQQFKDKMLKKSHVEMGSGSEKDFGQRERMNEGSRILGNEDQYERKHQVNFELEKDRVEQFTSNFGTGEKEQNYGNKKGQQYSLERSLSSESLRMMKRRNEMILNGLQAQQQQYESGQRQGNEYEEQQQAYSFKKSHIKVQNRPQLVQKPQIIHKSIGDKKMAYFSKYSNNEMDSLVNKDKNFGDQQPYDQRSSYQMGKMKSMLRIIDDYRQNAVENDLENKHLEISESFYKKSRFNSEKDIDSYQE